MCYQPKSARKSDLDLMFRIEELHLKYPFMGACMLRDQVNRAGFDICRKYVGTLMKHMGVEALCRKPGTSKKHPGYKKIHYLLRGKKISQPNEKQQRIRLKKKGYCLNKGNYFFDVIMFLYEANNTEEPCAGKPQLEICKRAVGQLAVLL
jgi:hypothetical protein